MAATERLFTDDFLSLPFRPDEKNAAADFDTSRMKSYAFSALSPFLQIDDVNPIPLGEDVGFIFGFHRRVWWPKWTPLSKLLDTYD